jgi:AcrR family transcriptional regulator
MALTTKEKIIKVATNLFSEVGYKSASVRKIASAVGIRESALYNHFKNKEEIFLTIAKDIFSTPIELNDDDINKEAKRGKAFLSRFGTQFKLITFDAHSQKMFRLLLLELFQNEALRKSFISEFHDKNIKLLSNAFFIMMQEGLIKSNDPMLLAYEFLSTLFYIRFQITLLRFDSISTNHLSTQIEKHIDIFWDGIKIS